MANTGLVRFEILVDVDPKSPSAPIVTSIDRGELQDAVDRINGNTQRIQASKLIFVIQED